ncbi:MAG: NADH-quinone oxidoreductase subunit C [Acidimicrobiia bacterium]|nr:NADH-quinone oxidoreductase subunit C [Actinomycetota bacterium]MBL6925038.1 NADH-quinone oxidoreductase subunit C [Acidimicrobiia bacterium]MBL6926871.1 NADH-quinone oxidoreductase subunit C [Acidimicrobiia bacterium]
MTTAVPETLSRGQRVMHLGPDQLFATASGLRDDGFLTAVDVTAVDYVAHPGRNDLPADVTPERFEVVVLLHDHQRCERIRLRVQVPEGDPAVPSLFDLFPGTEAMEREVFDLFGIVFDGHPDMTRILLPEEWEGHPLRKDVDTGRIPIQFREAPEPR